jgi:hypothetical protein
MTRFHLLVFCLSAGMLSYSQPERLVLERLSGDGTYTVESHLKRHQDWVFRIVDEHGAQIAWNGTSNVRLQIDAYGEDPFIWASEGVGGVDGWKHLRVERRRGA